MKLQLLLLKPRTSSSPLAATNLAVEEEEEEEEVPSRIHASGTMTDRKVPPISLYFLLKGSSSQ